MKFSDIIQRVNLPSGEIVESSGHPVILSDLLRAVVSEGPRVTLLSLFLVMVLVWLNFRRISETAVVITSLLIGVVMLLGLIAVVGIKLNFLNFVALPITFGIGVDYAVNIYQRLKQDGFKDINYSLSRIGGAVILCSSTTTIGYSVLLTSRSRALVTFGGVALAGEIVCLLVAVFILPNALKRLNRAGLMPFPRKVKLGEVLRVLANRPRKDADKSDAGNTAASGLLEGE